MEVTSLPQNTGPQKLMNIRLFTTMNRAVRLSPPACLVPNLAPAATP